MIRKILALTLIAFFFLVAPVFAGAQFIYPKFQAYDNNGDPLSWGLLYTYAANSSTAKATYSDRGLTASNKNPIVLDSRGEAVVYGAGQYKFILMDSAGSLIWTFDYLDGIGGYLGGNFFFPDAGQADQGVLVGSVTVKDFVDAIGATKTATIVLSRGSTGDNTDYTFLTSETIPSNINCQFEQGARVSIAITKTLTLYSPANIISQPNQQIFSGAGTVAFSVGGTVYPEWWGGYSTDAGVAINKAIASLPSGGIVSLPAQDVTYTTSIDITGGKNKITLNGAGNATVLRANLTTIAIDVTGSTWSCLSNFFLTDGGGASIPKVGVLYAREDGTPVTGGIGHKTRDLTIDGKFTTAAIYNYATEENRHYNPYIVNRANNAVCYWTTVDNDGTGEDVASVYVTIATGGQSNSETRFYGPSFLLFDGGNNIRMRGSVDCSYDGIFLYNPTGNSYVYIDNATVVTSSARISFTNFRGELGGGPDYGFHCAGTVNLGFWDINNGAMEVNTKIFYVPSNIDVFGLNWYRVNDISDVGMEFYSVSNSNIEFSNPINIRSSLGSSILRVDTTRLTVATYLMTNYIQDVNTGDVTIRAPFSLDTGTAGGVAHAYWKSAGVTKWDVKNQPASHTLIFASASGTRFIIGQGGIQYQQYVFAALDNTGTPSVASGYAFQTGGTTAITGFNDGVIGQVIVICGLHNVTITDNAAILLNGGVNFDMNSGDTLTLMKSPLNVWVELARGNNN